MNNVEQQFLNDLDKKLWNAADRLRSSLDAAVYKHIVLGLIFLKYASDAFDDRRVVRTQTVMGRLSEARSGYRTHRGGVRAASIRPARSGRAERQRSPGLR